MLSKSLAFFEGATVEVSVPIFSQPEARKRGRRTRQDALLPDGTPRPSRRELLAYILDHVLYQLDPSVGGPIFCKHIVKPNIERNRESMYHIVLGPVEWSGVWEIVGNRRMLDVRAVSVPGQRHWVPQIILSPGNYVGVDNLNGIELSREALREAMIARGFVDAETFDRFAAPSLAGRYRAIADAVPGIWM
ncbi:MAG: hypothetical protein OWV35_09550 [Firmicutes bacterium]|nr:hypothetical protein [Bacillota bacterium]